MPTDQFQPFLKLRVLPSFLPLSAAEGKQGTGLCTQRYEWYMGAVRVVPGSIACSRTSINRAAALLFLPPSGEQGLAAENYLIYIWSIIIY